MTLSNRAVRTAVTMTASLLLLSFTGGAADAAIKKRKDGPRKDRIAQGSREPKRTHGLLGFRDTHDDEIVTVSPHGIDGILTEGALQWVGSVLAKGLFDRDNGVVNVDLSYGDPMDAQCAGARKGTLVRVDLDPVWGGVVAGRPVPPCQSPSSGQIDTDLDQQFTQRRHAK